MRRGPIKVVESAGSALVYGGSMVEPASTKRHMNFSGAATAVGLLVAVCVLTVIARPDVATDFGVTLLLGPALPLVFASLAQMVIILVGDFDMGVGYAIGLVNVITATVLVTHPWFGFGLMVVMVLAYVGMGAIVEYFRIPAVVITLGASFIWLGVGLTIQPEPGGTAPGWLEQVANATLPVIPEGAYIILGGAIASWWVLKVWRYGVVLRGLGNNRTALVNSGWSPLATRMSAYALAGVLVDLGGLLTTSVTTSADVNASATLTLVTFAVVIIGGCQFRGGIVEPVGVVAAAVAFSLLASLLAFWNVSSSWNTAVEGLILVLAVSIKRIAQWFGGLRSR